MNGRLHLPYCCLLLTALCTGCGSGMATVEGTVTFNGEPVNRGSISLEPVDGKGPSAGGSVEGGKFRISEVTPGEKTVRINAVYVKGVEKQSDGSEVELCEDLLPKEWGRASTNKLSVEAPLTKRDFAIEGKDPRPARKK